MSTRVRHTAEYLYPGVFFPEETYRDLPNGTYEAALQYSPNESGYFKKDGWYAVIIRTHSEKRFVSEDGEETWVKQGGPMPVKIIVGEKIHYSDSRLSGDEFDILRSNIKNNDKNGGYGILTRCGNWQISSDWDTVVPG